MNNLKFKRKQKGYTFLELGLAFIIIATLSVALFFAYRILVADADADALKNNILSVRKAVVASYNRDFTSISSADVIKSGKLTNDMISGTNIVNAMGGIVTLSTESVMGGTNNAFSQTHPLVERSACNTLVNGFADILFQIDVGATTVKSDTITPTPSTIIAACDNDVNTIKFIAIK